MPVAFNNPTLAIFCSASNLNAPNTLGAYELARAAVGHGADFLYGAGDVENAPMWGSLQGALHGQIEHAVRKNTSYNLPRIWGISTLPLIKKETEEAKPPQGLDGSLIVNTLPEREGYLTTGGRITVPFAGGIGSDRENYARLVILPRFLPEVVRGKAFVISPINLVSHTGDGVNCYNDVPFGAMLGKRALAQLKKNPWALASEGIYYPRTQQELVQTTLRALDGGLGSLAPKPLRSPVPTRTVSHEQVLSLSACSK
jgi:predicted Rossmann-fold nucleotide-binding protein